MKKFVVLSGLFLLNFCSFSQIFDSFSDGDFPQWVGNRELFIVNSKQELQLNATEAGTAYLSLLSPQFSGVWEWLFYIRLPFSPSNNNFARVYLSANTTDLTSLFLEGYYLQFGENLAQDAIELFYQNGTSHTSICRGTEGRVSSSFSLNVKVRYTEPNHWEILVDEARNGMYETETTGVSTAQFEHAALGVYCKYTASNSKKFFFDDFYYGPPIVDTEKPKVVSLQPQQDGRTLRIRFSENVTSETALLSSNYIINNSIIPEECGFVNNDFSHVEISFNNEFKDRTFHTISIENIEDMTGNTMEKFSGSFCFAKIRRNDILITEIMAKPNPVVGLPNCEYIEFHNFGVPDTLVLQNWKLRINNSNKNLPEIRIPPKGYVFVVANSCTGYSDDDENIYRVSSLGVADGGTQIVLYNEEDEVIHEIAFSNSWHKNGHKAEGGWSLEMIDPDNPCSGADNWDSSISDLGGTPAKQNSIYSSNPDYLFPEIDKITIVDSLCLRVFFTETIFYDPMKSLQLFEIDRGIKIASVGEAPPHNNILQITLQQPLQPNVLYTLIMRDTIWDCAQNAILISGSVYRIALPSVPQPFDVVINEVLFNAKDYARAEFVELYNRSQKVIDLASLRIGSGGADLPDKSVPVVSSGFLLFPNEYVALCKMKTVTEEQYYVPYSDRLIQCDSLPSFTNSAGVIFLNDKSYNIIDRFQYDEKMHYPLLTSVAGVSLERVSFERETQNENNWKSAAESYGFATPGYQNSQFSNNSASNDLLKIVPEVFAPNQSGFADYVEIHCGFETPENRVTITIFDRYGNLIKTIANNQICALNEVFLWDGVSDKNYRVPPDLYIVKIEYWNLNAKRKTIRKTVGIVYP